MRCAGVARMEAPSTFSRPCAGPATDVLALYRLRWQIELAFKRLKSLAGLDLLPARSAALGRAWIAAKLIIATLIGWTIQGFLEAPPCEGRDADPPALGLVPV